MNKSKRILELDVLRGFASFGVMLYHYTTWYDHLYQHSPEVLLYFPKGKYCVELFFMISGFVIFMTLEKVRSSSDFIVGRFSRLYPAYWLSVVLTFAVVSISGLPGLAVEPYEAIANLTMFQSFFNIPHVDGSYWTLSLELSFYIIMLVIHRFKRLADIEKISLIWLFILFLSAISTRYLGIQIDSRLEILLLLNTGNLFIIGLMFYRIYKEGASPTRNLIIILSLLIYKLQYSGFTQKNFHSWAELLIVTSFVVLFKLLLAGKLKFININVFVFLGTISYSLYLIHQNIGYSIISCLYNFDVNPNIAIVVAVLASLVMASIITFSVEKSMVRLIKKKYSVYSASNKVKRR